MRGFAAAWLLLLIVLAVIMVLRFDALRTAAAALQLPYLVWLCFAMYLNLSVWLLNR